MIRTILVLLLLASPLPGWSATKTCPSGTLGPITSNTRSTDLVLAKGAPGIAFQAIRTAGTGDAIIEISCDGTNWSSVTNGTMTVDGTTTSRAVSVLYPACTYSVRVANCSSCNITVSYGCSGS